MKPAILLTEHLMLRRAHKQDAQNLFRDYFSDFYSSYYLTRKPHLHINQTREFLKEWCETPWDKESNKFAWVIAEIETNKGIGIFLVELEDTSTAQIHYGICPDCSRKGFITEAGRAVVQWLIYQKNTKRIWTACDLTHKGSIRVLEKLGFQNEGIHKKRLHLPALGDSPRDCYIYAYAHQPQKAGTIQTL